MVRRSLRFFQFSLTIAALVVLLYLSRTLWLRGLGYALIHEDGPAKADIAVVLAGDSYGTRIEKGAEMVRLGYTPSVLVDGPPFFYGRRESERAIEYIVSKGYPPTWFIDFPVQADSTQEEATLVLPELRRRNVQSYLLVTSDFHSARAGRIFRATQRTLGYGATMHVVVTHGPEFYPDRWWLTRPGKKTAFIEWCKTLGTALGQ